MTPPDVPFRIIRAGRWLLLGGALLAVASCRGQREEEARGAQRPRPTPAPSFRSIDSTSRADLLTYARGLRFDTTRPASDAQYLVVPRAGQLAVGSFAAIAPEIGAGTIRHQDLAEGRILARLALDRACPEAGLPGGLTYLWVDSTAGAFRTLLVPEADSVPVRQLPLRIRTLAEAGGPPWLPGSAWFEVLNVPADSQAMVGCWVCGHTICCSPDLMHDLTPAMRGGRPVAPSLRR